MGEQLLVVNEHLVIGVLPLFVVMGKHASMLVGMTLGP